MGACPRGCLPTRVPLPGTAPACRVALAPDVELSRSSQRPKAASRGTFPEMTRRHGKKGLLGRAGLPTAHRTCWSMPTASSPSYMMFTQLSLDESTNRDISACETRARWLLLDVASCRGDTPKDHTPYHGPTHSRPTHDSQTLHAAPTLQIRTRLGEVTPVRLVPHPDPHPTPQPCPPSRPPPQPPALPTWPRLSKLYLRRTQR